MTGSLIPKTNMTPRQLEAWLDMARTGSLARWINYAPPEAYIRELNRRAVNLPK